MCQKCKNPESDEGKAVRDYFLSVGKPFKLSKKTTSLLSRNDPFIVGNPHFTPETDMMPDGVHAKPRHMWVECFEQRAKNKDRMALGSKRRCEALEAEYAKLPDPKPEYLEWASAKMRPELFRALFKTATTSSKGATAVRAIATLLEFTKSKPKQETDR